MHLTKFAAVAVLALSVAACDSGRGGEAVGTVVGATAGGVIGNQFGSGSGKALATAAGIVAGGLIGNRIGAAADEEARRRADERRFEAIRNRRDERLRETEDAGN